jgi:SAM-dependent methyltransferase
MTVTTQLTLHCPCEGRFLEEAAVYDTPPPGETRFDLRGQPYRRAYDRCTLCGHWFARHDLDLSGLYSGEYVSATYGGSEGMARRLHEILALPPDRSDNAGRVARILRFAAGHFAPDYVPALLDIGAGVGVFPYAIQQAGWICTALDPDPQVGRHLTEAVCVRAVIGDFLSINASEMGHFDIITLNKVIEHVEDPVAMLAKAASLLVPSGFVYVEVPDVAAVVDGLEREEYFVEHHHVFSPASLAQCGERAGLSPLMVERLREPSGKYTLRAFFARDPAS